MGKHAGFFMWCPTAASITALQRNSVSEQCTRAVLSADKQ